MNFAVFANAGAIHDGNIGANPSAIANFYVSINGSERRNRNISPYFSVGMDMC
jgi:hypothetical protein